MECGEPSPRIQVFSTCPASTGFDRDSYVAQVVKVAQWSEQAGSSRSYPNNFASSTTAVCGSWPIPAAPRLCRLSSEGTRT